MVVTQSQVVDRSNWGFLSLTPGWQLRPAGYTHWCLQAAASRHLSQIAASYHAIPHFLWCPFPSGHSLTYLFSKHKNVHCVYCVLCASPGQIARRCLSWLIQHRRIIKFGSRVISHLLPSKKPKVSASHHHMPASPK